MAFRSGLEEKVADLMVELGVEQVRIRTNKDSIRDQVQLHT